MKAKHPTFGHSNQSRTQSLLFFWQGREALDSADEKVRIIMISDFQYQWPIRKTAFICSDIIEHNRFIEGKANYDLNREINIFDIGGETTDDEQQVRAYGVTTEYPANEINFY